MITASVFVVTLAAALGLTLMSAWLASRLAYFAILLLLAAALVAGELRHPTPFTLMSVGVNLIIFGFFFYYVTLQFLLQRKAKDIATREEFRDAMISQQRFSGAIKVLYYLPLFLMIAAIICAVIGSRMQGWTFLEG